MGFVLGLLLGLLAAVGLFGYLAYWLCTRFDTSALVKFISDIAQTLAQRPQSTQPSTPGKSRWGRDGEQSKT
jgi:hypothetical protein